MKGTLYCVGLGPGDPDLVTLKTLRLLQKCDIIALPQNKGGEGMAATILRRLFEQEGMDFSTKTCCPLSFPMTYDEKALANAHEDSAITLKTYLDDGNDVVLATIGCPTIMLHLYMSLKFWNARAIRFPSFPVYQASVLVQQLWEKAFVKR